MKVVDIHDGEILKAVCPYAVPLCSYCCCMFCNCCAQNVEVYSHSGTKLGCIHQEFNFSIKDKYSVCDATNNVILTIEPPYFVSCSRFSNIVFDIKDSDDKKIGAIIKFSNNVGLSTVMEQFVFSLSFPLHLDVHSKSLLIGALILIDFMYFEQTQDISN